MLLQCALGYVLGVGGRTAARLVFDKATGTTQVTEVGGALWCSVVLGGTTGAQKLN